MFFRIKSYLRFLVRATNQHGVHSPFVYNLLTNAMYQKPLQVQLDFYKLCQMQLSKLRASQCKNEKNIRVFEKSSLSKKRALLLMRLVVYFKPSTVLEIESLSGMGTSIMAFASKKTKVTSLGSSVQNTEYLASNFASLSLKNIELIAGSFEKKLPTALQNKKYDFVFFNTSLAKKDRLEEFYSALNAVHNDSVFIFDAIYLDKGMEGVWEKIKSHPKVKVTLDTYRWGIVFFRKEQVKEHFIIRV